MRIVRHEGNALGMKLEPEHGQRLVLDGLDHPVFRDSRDPEVRRQFGNAVVVGRINRLHALAQPLGDQRAGCHLDLVKAVLLVGILLAVVDDPHGDIGRIAPDLASKGPVDDLMAVTEAHDGDAPFCGAADQALLELLANRKLALERPEDHQRIGAVKHVIHAVGAADVGQHERHEPRLGNGVRHRPPRHHESVVHAPFRNQGDLRPRCRRSAFGGNRPASADGNRRQQQTCDQAFSQIEEALHAFRRPLT